MLFRSLKVRFEFDYDNDSGQVKVTGDGVNTLAELEAKVKDGARYANYLAGSKATGGGAAGGQGSGVPAGRSLTNTLAQNSRPLKKLMLPNMTDCAPNIMEHEVTPDGYYSSFRHH